MCVCVCVCVCLCVCARARVRVCECVRVCACVCVVGLFYFIIIAENATEYPNKRDFSIFKTVYWGSVGSPCHLFCGKDTLAQRLKRPRQEADYFCIFCRCKMSGTVALLFHMLAWLVQGQRDLCFTLIFDSWRCSLVTVAFFVVEISRSEGCVL